MIRVLIGAFVVALLFMPNYRRFEKGGDNCFTIFLYGEAVGVIAKESHADDLLAKARKSLAARSSSLVMLEPMDYEVRGENVAFKTLDSDKEIVDKMTSIMQQHERKVSRTAYTMKVRGMTVNLSSAADIKELLERTIAKYNTDGKYEVLVQKDEDRDLNVLTAFVHLKDEDQEKFTGTAGAGNVLDDLDKACADAYYTDFDDYKLGLLDMGLSEEIEVVMSTVSSDDILSVEDAMALLTEE